ncbi:hypothetical protein [Treponema zioleckii]|uniref:hypothetical protein n=1 Tax=Treponema zioleckii TaxID=331680 RepID=UPI00168AABA0|nr:hypothetical protein [Treponema zioleckii]
MKKSLFLIPVLLTLILGSCASKKQKDNSLVEHGLSSISLMSEKAKSKDYVSLLFGNYNDQVNQKISELASSEMEKPTHIYRLDGDFLSNFNLLLSTFGASFSEDSIKDFSPRLQTELLKRLFTSFPSIWNAKLGTTEIAAAAIFTTQTTFVSNDLKEDCIYIFEFQDAYPVAVTFLGYEGNAVTAQADFIFDRDFVKSLTEFFSSMNINLKLKEIN